MKQASISRRAFLGAAGAAATSLLLPRRGLAAPGTPAGPGRGILTPNPARFGKWGLITGWTPVRYAPEHNTELSAQLSVNTIVPLLETVEGTALGGNPNNNTWYRIAEGFIYTATVHAMDPYRMPDELTEIPHTIDDEPGFWAEVIVPETYARTEPSGTLALSSEEERVILSNTSVHRVIEIDTDEAGFTWYKLHNDKPNEEDYWALARHLRYIPPQDLAPIRPEVTDKRIEVNIAEGRINCFEGDTLVMSTLTSSGAAGWDTPRGEWAVIYTQPSRRMYSGDGSAASGGDVNEGGGEEDAFDLPGVPFCTFFTTLGHAIHGTWWHGDYGRPRSHGCLNVTSDKARWIWRWTAPASPYDLSSDGSATDPGTPVIVI